MGKSELLVRARKQLLDAAKKAQITEILFYLPIDRDWEEEDDFVPCMVNITVPPDSWQEHARGDKLKEFARAAEQCLQFKLEISALDISKEIFSSILCPESQQQYGTMINATISLEQLSGEKPLLEQLQAKVKRYKERAIHHQEVALEKGILEPTSSNQPTIQALNESPSSIKPSTFSYPSSSFYSLKTNATMSLTTSTATSKSKETSHKRKREPEKIETRPIQKVDLENESGAQVLR